MLFFLRIKLDYDEKNKLIKKTIQNTEHLTQYDFRRIFKVLYIKEELGNIFKEILDIGEYEKIGKLTISLDALFLWIHEHQNEKINNETEIKNFFEQIKTPNIVVNNYKTSSERFLNEDDKVNFTINFEEFCLFMFSPLNSIYDQQKLQTRLDLNQPLSHYFINSSFNSYLWGDSLYGSVSLEYYRRVIEKGCRMIQLNVFDGIEGPVISKNNSI